MVQITVRQASSLGGALRTLPPEQTGQGCQDCTTLSERPSPPAQLLHDFLLQAGLEASALGNSWLMEQIQSLRCPQQTNKVAVSPAGWVCSQVSQDPAFPSFCSPRCPMGTRGGERSVCWPCHCCGKEDLRENGGMAGSCHHHHGRSNGFR